MNARGELEGLRLGIYSRASDDEDGTESSVTTQAKHGGRFAERHGCVIVDRYVDNDKSASWFAKKARPDFDRLLSDIAAGKLDLVWFFTISRSQRDLGTFAKLRDLCRAKGVRLAVKNRVYDLSDAADLRTLGAGAVDAEVFSVELSQNVVAGMQEAAEAGKPHGPTAYGYRREYDRRGRYARQVPDEETAPIVREIITRIAKGHYVAKIGRELEDRGVPAPSGGAHWSRSVLRRIAANPVYVGKRVYRGEVLDLPEPCWKPLVTEDAFYRAQAVLNSPNRKTTKPGRARWLLSYIMRCECGKQVQNNSRDATRSRRYICVQGHNQIIADPVDEFVMAVIDAYLGREDVREYLAQGSSDDSVVVAARTEAAKLRLELEQNRAARERGDLDLAEFLRFKKSLTDRIEAAEARAEEAAIPPVLRTGSVDWDDIPLARQAVAMLADITLKRGDGPISERITWRWLIGPDAVDAEGHGSVTRL